MAQDPLLDLSGDLDGLPEDLSDRFDDYLDQTFAAEPTTPPQTPRPRSTRR